MFHALVVRLTVEVTTILEGGPRLLALGALSNLGVYWGVSGPDFGCSRLFDRQGLLRDRCPVGRPRRDPLGPGGDLRILRIRQDSVELERHREAGGESRIGERKDVPTKPGPSLHFLVEPCQMGMDLHARLLEKF